MTPLQELITIALPSTQKFSNIHRAKLLDAAAENLDGDLARLCAAQAVCLRNAEEHQLKIDSLLQEDGK